jgi:hypothetical protein
MAGESFDSPSQMSDAACDVGYDRRDLAIRGRKTLTACLYREASAGMFIRNCACCQLNPDGCREEVAHRDSNARFSFVLPRHFSNDIHVILFCFLFAHNALRSGANPRTHSLKEKRTCMRSQE